MYVYWYLQQNYNQIKNKQVKESSRTIKSNPNSLPFLYFKECCRLFILTQSMHTLPSFPFALLYNLFLTNSPLLVIQHIHSNNSRASSFVPILLYSRITGVSIKLLARGYLPLQLQRMKEPIKNLWKVEHDPRQYFSLVAESCHQDFAQPFQQKLENESNQQTHLKFCFCIT